MNEEQIKQATKGMNPQQAEMFLLTQRVIKLEKKLEEVGNYLESQERGLSEVRTQIKRLDLATSGIKTLDDKITQGLTVLRQDMNEHIKALQPPQQQDMKKKSWLSRFLK